jgi:hypothetical protein
MRLIAKKGDIFASLFVFFRTFAAELLKVSLLLIHNNDWQGAFL